MTNRIVLEGGNIFKDMTGQTCQKCKKDKYQERSQHDDMDGKVTCSCGNRVDRWKKYKEQGVAEGSLDASRNPDTDQILQHLTSGFRTLERHKDWYNDFSVITKIYSYLRSSLMKGDYEDFSNCYEDVLAKYPDAAGELIEAMFESAGLDDRATIEDFFAKISEQGVAEGSGMTNRIVLEGGNIFKDEDGTPVTQRINRADVDPTLAWIEKITGIPHKDFKLGSTGIRATSGDMDIAVNQAEVDKADLYNKLAAWAQQNHPDDDVRQWVAKSGISVHFKTPINGDPEQGYVQTDLMFGDPEWMKFTLKGAGDDTPYKGVHRNILIASVAKGMGFKFSPKDGLVNRETGDVVSNNPDQIAEILLGPGNKRDALDSVESIIAKLKSNPDYDKLTADAKEYFARENLTLPESVTAKVGTTDWFSQLSERLK